MRPCDPLGWSLVVGYVRLQASGPLGLADLLIADMRAFAQRRLGTGQIMNGIPG
jgi:hypothetical protein